MAKVKKTYSLDEEVVAKISELASALHLSDSAFLSMVVSQIAAGVDVVVLKAGAKEGGE